GLPSFGSPAGGGCGGGGRGDDGTYTGGDRIDPLVESGVVQTDRDQPHRDRLGLAELGLAASALQGQAGRVTSFAGERRAYWPGAFHGLTSEITSIKIESMDTDRSSSLVARAQVHAALGEPARLAIVDQLLLGDA